MKTGGIECNGGNRHKDTDKKHLVIKGILVARTHREKDIKNDNAVQPSSIDALGGGRARRGGGPHDLAQQGEDSRFRSKDTTP